MLIDEINTCDSSKFEAFRWATASSDRQWSDREFAQYRKGDYHDALYNNTKLRDNVKFYRNQLAYSVSGDKIDTILL